MHVECVSNNESSNAIYLHKTEMQKNLKGKVFARADSNSPHCSNDDTSIYTGLPKSTTRNPRWPEDHNIILGELLLEQYMNGNFCNGNLRKEQWSTLVAALNRRLGSNYTESSVIIQFKNMKADFRALYQLTNSSCWGWDEELHVPVAPDELWDEIVQVSPKLIRYRRHPFHQYSTFEKIRAENIAIGISAKSTKATKSTVNLEEYETPHFADVFMVANGVSYDMDGIPNSNLPDAVDDVPHSVDVDGSPMVRSKRSSDEPHRSTKHSKKKGGLGNLNELLVESNKNAVVLKETIQRTDPYTMIDYLVKLSQLENLTTQALIALQDAFKENKDNKAIFMTWEGDVLTNWIEYIVSTHPCFYASKVWL
ncbi:hypothetical protein M5K25_014814 [Dendrobium thyrsiflorum]|uniref:Myb/SANT-like domain-containing protein n=1 Tax=Dendrobium thyrsiflorum TaxID=117978 RepID=A0ABD0UVT4_DENTH